MADGSKERFPGILGRIGRGVGILAGICVLGMLLDPAFDKTNPVTRVFGPIFRAITGLGPEVTTFPSREEEELQRLRADWLDAVSAPEAREAFYARVLTLFNFTNDLGHDSVAWLDDRLTNGAAEGYIVDFVLPLDLQFGTVTEAELDLLSASQLSKQVDLAGGVRPFLAKQARLFGCDGKVVAGGTGPAWAANFGPTRCRLIANVNAGVVSDAEALRQVLDTPRQLPWVGGILSPGDYRIVSFAVADVRKFVRR